MSTQILSVLPPEKRHSNVFYSYCVTGQDDNGKSIREYVPVATARAYENSYGLDLVSIGSGIVEGRSGLYICGKKELAEVMERSGHVLQGLIKSAVEKNGLSPRYTRPNEKKSDVFPKQAKN